MNLYDKLKAAEKIKLELDLTEHSKDIENILKVKPFVMYLTIAEAFDLQAYFIGGFDLNLNELYSIFK